MISTARPAGLAAGGAGGTGGRADLDAAAAMLQGASTWHAACLTTCAILTTGGTLVLAAAPPDGGDMPAATLDLRGVAGFTLSVTLDPDASPGGPIRMAAAA
jgi:hypothetical protein